MDGRRIPPNKPTQISNASVLTFGNLTQQYVVECETAGKQYLASSLLRHKSKLCRLDCIGQMKDLIRHLRTALPVVCSHVLSVMLPAGTKRKKPDNENMDKGTVRASHLLVKHR